MKKTLLIIFAFVFLFSVFALSISAEEEVDVMSYNSETYTNLGKYLDENGMIDDLGFYYYLSTGYNPEQPDVKPHSEIVVYLRSTATEETRQLIRDIATDFDVIVLKNCTYSYTDLKTIVGELMTLSSSEYIRALSVSANELDTVLVVDVDIDSFGTFNDEFEKTFSEYATFIELRKYDPDYDRTGVLEIGFNPGDGEVVTTGNYGVVSKRFPYAAVIIPSCVVILALVVFVLYRKAMAKKMVTSTGETVTTYTSREIKEMASENLEPSESVYRNIKEEIDK